MKDAQEQTNFTITKSDQAKISQQVEDLLIRMSRDGSSIPFRNAIDAAHALGYAAISPILAIITEQENVYAAALYSLAHALRKDHGAELADDMVSQGTLDWLETYRQNRRESALATMQKIFQSQ